MSVLRYVLLFVLLAVAVSATKPADEDFPNLPTFYDDIPENERDIPDYGMNDDDFLRGKVKSAEVYDYDAAREAGKQERRESRKRNLKTRDRDDKAVVDERMDPFTSIEKFEERRRESTRPDDRIEKEPRRHRQHRHRSDKKSRRDEVEPEVPPMIDDMSRSSVRQHRHRSDKKSRRDEVEVPPMVDDMSPIPFDIRDEMPQLSPKRRRRHHRQHKNRYNDRFVKKLRADRPDVFVDEGQLLRDQQPVVLDDPQENRQRNLLMRRHRKERRDNQLEPMEIEQQQTTQQPDVASPKPSLKPRIRPSPTTTTTTTTMPTTTNTTTRPEPKTVKKAPYYDDVVMAPSSAELRRQIAMDRAERGELLSDDSLELLLSQHDGLSAEMMRPITKFHEAISPKKSPKDAELIEEERRWQERQQWENEEIERLRREQEEHQRVEEKRRRRRPTESRSAKKNDKLYGLIDDLIATQEEKKSDSVKPEDFKVYKVSPYIVTPDQIQREPFEEVIIEDDLSPSVAPIVVPNKQERLENVKVFLNNDKKDGVKPPVEVIVERPSRQEFIQQKENERQQGQPTNVAKPDVEIVRPLPAKSDTPVAPLVIVVDSKKQPGQQVAANEQGVVKINVAPASGADKLARPASMLSSGTMTESKSSLRVNGSRWAKRQILSGLPVTSDANVYCKAVFAATPQTPKRHFADPTTCTAFFFCNFGASADETSGTRTVCAAGQRYSASMLTCVPAWNQNDICAADPCEDANSAASAATCWVDPSNCRQFYSCSSGWSVPKCCPAGTSATASCQCDVTVPCSSPGCTNMPTATPSVPPPQPIVNANNTCFDSSLTELRPEGTNGFQSHDPYTGTWFSFLCPADTSFELASCACVGTAPTPAPATKPYRQCSLFLPLNDDYEDFSASQTWTQPFGAVSISKGIAASGAGSAFFNGGRLEIEGFNNKELGQTVSWCLMYRCSPDVNDPSKTSCSSSQGTLLSNGVSPDYSLIMQLTGNSRSITIETAPAGQTLAASSTQPLGNDAWHQLCGIFDGNQLQLFEDGKLVQATPGSTGKKNIKTIQAPYSLGANRLSNNPFIGYIDDVLVCQSVLSADEMTAHRSGDRATLVNAGLVPPCPARRLNC